MTKAEETAGSPDEAEKYPEEQDGELTLEARLRRLDEIVGQLEGGEVELERGLALFEEGVRHIRASETLLSQAELRVEELVGESESLRTQPMDGPVE